MKRLKLILPAGRPGDLAMIAHAQLVDADTGEALDPVRGIRLELPFDQHGPGVLVAQVEVAIAEIETVPPEREAEIFPNWERRITVGLRRPPEPS